MTAVALAAAAGLSYGASDFSGAVASKDNDATAVAAAVQVVSLALLGGIVAVVGATLHGADLAWGALAGLGGGLGLATFYRALALGPMSTAASITALVGATVPVGVGLALGDRPAALTLAGVALAVPAGVLVATGGSEGMSRSLRAPRDRAAMSGGRRRTQALSIVAGLGFSLFFIALSRTSADAGLIPLVAARGTSVAALGAYILGSGVPVALRWTSLRTVVIAGALDCVANVCYLSALKNGDFTWVAALSSLYPVSTVLLARVLLDERLTRIQLIGLSMAGAAMVLVASSA